MQFKVVSNLEVERFEVEWNSNYMPKISLIQMVVSIFFHLENDVPGYAYKMTLHCDWEGSNTHILT